MSYQKLKFKISSLAPLIMNSPTLSDPLSSDAKELKKITSKRVKTDDDQEEIAKRKWYAALYLENGKPCIPSTNIEAMLVASAKKNKLGKVAKAALFVDDNAILNYKGPKTADKLWLDENFRLRTSVVIQRARVMSMRPMFKEWDTEFTVQYDTELIDKDTLVEMVSRAGTTIGICDWRPKYGRFTSTTVEK